MKLVAFSSVIIFQDHTLAFRIAEPPSVRSFPRHYVGYNLPWTRAPRCQSQDRSSASLSSGARGRTGLKMSFWDAIQGAGTQSTTTLKPSSQKSPVLICPAQLSVPRDYSNVVTELNKRGYPAYCADLTRVGWITGLLPSALSLEYFKGELVPADTLKFYYEAIGRALDDAKRDHPGAGIHIVGHSIGGWVARAWLAEECSSTDRASALSLTTLGTPNMEPAEEAGPWAKVDQTRGLLKNINTRFPGAHVGGVRYTSVVGTAVQGKFPGSPEEMLAFVSYLPLSGDGSASGDGIIPRDVAVLEGSDVVELPSCKHSGFVPFPGKAIDLGDDYLWYGSPSLLDGWIKNLEEAERTSKTPKLSVGGILPGWPW